jgi:hypothetical protein
MGPESKVLRCQGILGTCEDILQVCMGLKACGTWWFEKKFW